MASELSKIINIILKATDETAGAFSSATKSVQQYETALNTLGKIDAFKGLKASVESSLSAWKSAEAQIKGFGQSLSIAKSELASNASALSAAKKAVEDYGKQVKASGTSTKEQSAEMARLKAELANVQKAYNTSAKSVSTLEKEFTAAKTSAKTLKDTYTSQNQSLAKMRQELAAAGVNTKNLSASTAALRRELESVKKAADAEAAAEKNRAIIGVRSNKAIKDEIAALIKAYNDLSKSGVASSAEIARASAATKAKVGELSKELSGVTASIGDVVAAFTQLAASIGSIAFPISVAAVFERSMSEVESIAGATSYQMQDLTKAVEYLGTTTEFTNSEIAAGAKYLAMAGLSIDQMIGSMDEAGKSTGALTSTQLLAKAGALDLGQAADIVTNIMTGYRIEAEKLGEVSDILVQTFTNTNSTLGEIGFAFRYVGPIARGLGVDFAELSTAIGALHNAGLKGTMAGTALRGMLSTLYNPTKAEADIMKELAERAGQVSIELTDAEGSFVGFSNILKQFENANVSAAESLELMGDRAGPGFAALLAMGSDGLAKLNGEIKNSKGRAEEVARIMGDNLRGAFDRFGSALEQLMTIIGNQFIPIITDIVEKLNEWMVAISEFAAQNKTLTNIVVLAAGAITIFVGAGTALMTLFGLLIKLGASYKVVLLSNTVAAKALSAANIALSTTFTLLSAKMKLLLFNPLGIAVTLFAGAIALLNDNVNKFVSDITIFGVRIGDLGAKLGVFAVGLYAWITGDKELAASVKATNEEIDKSTKAHAEHASTLKSLTKDISELKIKVADVRQEYDAAAQKVFKLNEEVSRLKEEAGTAIDEFAEASKAAFDSLWESINTSSTAINDYTKRIQDVQTSLVLSAEDKAMAISKIEAEQAEYSVEIAKWAVDERIKDIETESDLRQGVIDAMYKDIAGKEKKYADESLDLTIETTEKRQDAYRDLTDIVTAELEEAISEEKKYADKVIGLTNKIESEKQSTEEKIRDLKRGTMSELDAFSDEEREIQEKIAAGYALLAEGTDEAAVKAKDYFESAKAQAAGLATEVEENGKVVITQSQGTAKAIGYIESASKGVTDSYSLQKDAALSAHQVQQEAAERLQSTLDTLNATLDNLAKSLSVDYDIKVGAETENAENKISELTKKREIQIVVGESFNELQKELSKLNTSLETLVAQKEVEIARSKGTVEEIAEAEAALERIRKAASEKAEVEVGILTNAKEVESLYELAFTVEDLGNGDHVIGISTDVDKVDFDKIKKELDTYTDNEQVIVVNINGDYAEASIGELKDAFYSVKNEMESNDPSIALDNTQFNTGVDESKSKIESIPDVTTKYLNIETGGQSGSGISSVITDSMSGLDAYAEASEERIAEMGESLTDTINSVGENMGQLWSGKYISDWVSTIEDAAGEVEENLNSVTETMAGLADLFNTDYEFNIEFQGTGAGNARDLWSTMDNVVSGFQDMYNEVKTASNNFTEDISADLASQVEDSAEAYSAMVDGARDYLDALHDEWENLEDQINEVGDAIIDLNEDVADKIADINKEMMSDYEQYWLERQEFENIMAEARAAAEQESFELAQSLYQEAIDLAGNLAREVTDANGEVILSLSKTSADAIELLSEAESEAYSAMIDYQQALEENQEANQESIDTTEEKIGVLAESLDALVAVLEEEYVITIDTDPAIAAVTNLLAEANSAIQEVMEQSSKNIASMIEASAAGLLGASASVQNQINIEAENLAYTQDYWESILDTFQNLYGDNDTLALIVDFFGTGSTKRPLGEKINELMGMQEDFQNQLSTPTNKSVEFSADAGKGEKSFTDAMDDITAGLYDIAAATDSAASLSVNLVDEEGNPLSDNIDEVQESFDTLLSGINDGASVFESETNGFDTAIDNIDDTFVDLEEAYASGTDALARSISEGVLRLTDTVKTIVNDLNAAGNEIEFESNDTTSLTDVPQSTPSFGRTDKGVDLAPGFDIIGKVEVNFKMEDDSISTGLFDYEGANNMVKALNLAKISSLRR